eukprot:scaffold676239_cov117-Prasinocladus_malaysianus.AAC.1
MQHATHYVHRIKKHKLLQMYKATKQMRHSSSPPLDSPCSQCMKRQQQSSLSIASNPHVWHEQCRVVKRSIPCAA